MSTNNKNYCIGLIEVKAARHIHVTETIALVIIISNESDFGLSLIKPGAGKGRISGQ